MTKIEKWLRDKQIAWNKDVEEGFEDAPQNAKAIKDAVENFIEFAFSDDLCFIDEDEDDSIIITQEFNNDEDVNQRII